MRATPLIALCCVTLLMASVAAAAQKFKPAPSCRRESKLLELEASLKGEKEVPYVVEFQGRGQSCGQLPPRPNVNFEVRVCAPR